MGNPKDETAPSSINSYRSNSPIAIVGMACRFPQANDLDAFWCLLESGKSAILKGEPGSGIGRIGELFPDPVDAPACRFGAYLDDVTRFDAAFFRISPVEAQFLDPQQRLMLETCWRAIEDAGFSPDRLRGSRTGVYAGICHNEYRSLILDSYYSSEPAASLYAVSGTAFNTAIGRVSFALGLEGPAVAVDTACSSSLVAIHQAISGLQKYETDLALAGGTHAMQSGRLLEYRANAGMLSPDGRCATFDAAANGYVRGEGCGIVVLKRLVDAQVDGDRIWGVIRSTALNQDGASPGLTVPNGIAQERVMTDALQRAGVMPSEVDYVEAHGTGTEVGDPIEIQATGSVYSQGRDADQPLLIGSVKTNIGHTEAAAGIAGVIKVLLAMEKGVIPRHLNFETPNPAVDWDRLRMTVTATATPWPQADGRPRRAGVSGFGWSGTNAHIIIESYGEAVSTGDWVTGRPIKIAARIPKSISRSDSLDRQGAGRPTRLLPVSAKSDAALKELAQRHLNWLDSRTDKRAGTESDCGTLLSDLAYTASIGRSHFAHRAGILFDNATQLRSGLKTVAENGQPQAARSGLKIAFLFTGQGSQWVGMGEDLYRSEPVARAIMDCCEEVFRSERGTSMLDVMFGGSAEQLTDTRWAQPAIYALECAFTAMWISVGIRPDVVVGHSVGEFGAAYSAGVFGLEDGMRIMVRRSEILASLPGSGAMAALFAPRTQVEASVQDYNSKVESEKLGVAAFNGAHQVISGEVEAVEAVARRFETQGIRVSRLRTNQAFHSPLIEPGLQALGGLVDGFSIAPPKLTLVSNVTGKEFGRTQLLDATYLRRHARQAVLFDQSVETLCKLGIDLAVEVGPHSVLGPMLQLAWPQSDGSTTSRLAPAMPPRFVSSSRRPANSEDESGSGASFLNAVKQVYESGADPAFDGLFASETRRRISIPGYPFQRERYWVAAPRRRKRADHPLLGDRRASASGEISFESEVFPSDPTWLGDHRVFGRIIAPGALYGAMAAALSVSEGSENIVVEEMQFHNAMVFAEDGQEDKGEIGRKVQVLKSRTQHGKKQSAQIFSKGEKEREWVLHAEFELPSGAHLPQSGEALILKQLTQALRAQDISDYYQSKADIGIELGSSFRTLKRLWVGQGEAVGEVSLPGGTDRGRIEVHPLLLDGCFQVMGAARNSDGDETGTMYLPFAWERFWLTGALPERIYCHVRLKDAPANQKVDSKGGGNPEVFAADLSLYDYDGRPIGGLGGFMVKRSTQSALLSSMEQLSDLLYEIVWRESILEPGMLPADFLPDPLGIARQARPYSSYLSDLGVAPESRIMLLNDLEVLSHAYALATLEALGWTRHAGDAVDSEHLRQHLGVGEEHKRLFRRMLEMLAKAGLLEQISDSFIVKVDNGESLPKALPRNVNMFTAQLLKDHPHASTEIKLFKRCAGALANVLRGLEDPLSLLFGAEEPTAADLYGKAPVARAANKLLADAIASLLENLPADRTLRVVEVGAGTGSATAVVLPELPKDRYHYTYTDVSAGFFAEAEQRFGGVEASIEYRRLDIEQDPTSQGFPLHGYDLLIASNVLHATRFLGETLVNCRRLLAPSGQLVALENLRAQGWLNLTFGQLDGWWRFADEYRTHHVLASPAVWKTALSDSGFGQTAIVGLDDTTDPDRGVILARGPAEVDEAPGIWMLASDRSGVAADLADELSSRNQTVLLVAEDHVRGDDSSMAGPGVFRRSMDLACSDSWRSLLSNLAEELPLKGIAHLLAVDSHGVDATVDEMTQDVSRVGKSALALTKAIISVDARPENGVWIITCGAQIIERDRVSRLAGATLWGLGKVLAREAAHLRTRMLDLDPNASERPHLANELLYPDDENHIAYRFGRRRAARLIRVRANSERLLLPNETHWRLEPDAGGTIDEIGVESQPQRTLNAREVRVTVEAAGLNFRDLFRAMGVFEEGQLGGEMCGRVAEIGSEVSSVTVGDRIVGLAWGTFGSEAKTHEELVVPVPSDYSAVELATIPAAFTSAVLSFGIQGLGPDDKVLIHAGAGGVGSAAIQLAQDAGAEVFATASKPKQAFLYSRGVKHVYNSRNTNFSQEILEVTGGDGIDVVLNSLTGPGFIEASLSCLKQGGRFIEMSRVDILSVEEMAAVRPDVTYSILEVDRLTEYDPQKVGDVLRYVMELFEAGRIEAPVHTRWGFSEAKPAMKFMQAARHIGKIILTASPLEHGRLREDRTYLVTGGLGGIGSALAAWLAERGAGAIVLNGRGAPDEQVETAVESLRAKGHDVHVEIADVTDFGAMDELLSRIDTHLPPLGGVIHSVGVLSDGALINQNWEQFEEVLWPKVLGAWHLHRLTEGRDLDLFVLFSSAAGILGNPGQANHAAANAFLDQLAGFRRALGLPGQAIAWGAWSDIGEAEEQRERIEELIASRGVSWITPEQGFEAFDWLMRQDLAASVVTAVDWPVFGDTFAGTPSLLNELFADRQAVAQDDLDLAVDLIARFRGRPKAERENLLVSFLQQELKAVLRLPNVPEPTVGFFDLGMDSLMAVEFRNRINRAVAGEYVAPNTMVFDYPDIASLARNLCDELEEAEPGSTSLERPTSAASPNAVSQTGEEQIAVIGMAGRFPGAPDILEFWRMLESGENAVKDTRSGFMPVSRESNGAKLGVLGRGGFVEGLDLFDARFFGIRPIEARMMDPQQRWLLEVSWHALEDAGIDPGTLRNSRSGIYAGLGASEYQDLLRASGTEQGFTGTSTSIAIGRIAYFLGLTGPAVPVNMTCASSLVSIHMAAASLRHGEIDLALAGGVHTILSSELTKFLSDYGMLSPTGDCRTFDAAADGFVRGEGCGMVVLKRLTDALTDGDRIWGIIRGSSVNQNGASAALSVPNGMAQEQVLEEALNNAGIAPSDVDFLEVHGIGSQLGDPVEVRAAAAVYGRGREANRPLLLGTVKTNIGHLESAAGIAGLIKVLLTMNSGLIPKLLHFKNPNPYIDWAALPVQVVSEAMDWPLPTDRPPRAGISAFAFSGANAHVLVEGYPQPSDANHQGSKWQGPIGPPIPVAVQQQYPDSVTGPLRPRRKRLLPISGKSGSALRDLSQEYLDWLDRLEEGHLTDEFDQQETLSDLAWTAAVGRSHFAYRKGIVFENMATLREELIALSSSNGIAPVQTLESCIAFVFPTESGHWIDNVQPYYEREPEVRAVLDRCDNVLRDQYSVSLHDIVFGGRGGADDPTLTACVTYAVECAFGALWTSIGVRPRVVLGIGVGELAAAHFAQAIELEDGFHLALNYGRVVAAQASGDRINQALTNLETIVAQLSVDSPAKSLICSTSGELVNSDAVLDAAYWRRHASEHAAIVKCAESLSECNVEIMISIGPDPGLQSKIASVWPAGSGPTSIGSQSAKAPIWLSLVDSPTQEGHVIQDELAWAAKKIYETGIDFDFKSLFAGENRRRVSLPSYPFQRRRFWYDS